MQKTRLLFAAAALCVNFVCGQLYDLVYQNRPSKQHFYVFKKCDPLAKPGHHVLYRVSTRTHTLKVCNYSLIQLFSLAAGDGRLIPCKYALSKSLRPEKLFVKYGYEISIAAKDVTYLYKMMMNSLRSKFPEYEVFIKNEGRHRLVVVSDRQKLRSQCNPGSKL